MPAPQSNASEGIIRVLSIDGGGIRGILPSKVLQHIEDSTGKNITALFHLISGTSTGGIIACGLACGLSSSELCDLYAKEGGSIFARSMWRTVTTVANLDGPKYSADALEEKLLTKFHGKWLSEAEGAELLVPSYCITLPKPVELDDGRVQSTRMPFLFKSWKARGLQLDKGEVKETYDFMLRDIARATSAAPTYFPPAKIENRRGDLYWMVDGGVFANNPAMCALASARKIFPDAKRFLVVSLGTGCRERSIDGANAADWGAIGWLHPVLSILMDGNADTVCYELDQMLGEFHKRFDISLGTDPAKDPCAVYEDFDDADPDNIQRLIRLAGKLIDDGRVELDKLCETLSEPKIEVVIKEKP